MNHLFCIVLLAASALCTEIRTELGAQPAVLSNNEAARGGMTRGGTSGNNQPTTLPNEPTTGDNSPTTGANSPTTGNYSPTTGDNSGTNGVYSPTRGKNSPTNGANSPTYGDNSPTTGANSPTHGFNSPATGPRGAMKTDVDNKPGPVGHWYWVATGTDRPATSPKC